MRAFVYATPLLLVLLLSCVRFLRRLFPRPVARRTSLSRRVGETGLPGISVIVSIDVEENRDERRLCAALATLNALDYPDEKLDIVFVCDGPTDHRNEILRLTSNPMRQIVVICDPAGDPAAAVDKAVCWAQHDILVFSGASTVPCTDALRELAAHFRGSVSGALCSTAESWKWSEPPASFDRESLWHRDLLRSGVVALRREYYFELARTKMRPVAKPADVTAPRFALSLPLDLEKIAAFPLDTPV
jgi:cellulose synthase/poly-beta-1,6-N-acetylglucosamine synthase-like glycosyltransferase